MKMHHALLLLLCLVTVSGCATLPNAQEKMAQAPSSADQSIKIMGPKGEISPQKSQAMIKKLEQQVDETEVLQQQVQLMQSISESPLVAGNKATLLIDGEATYAAMFEAIGNARDHVNIESYIFADDETGKLFADLLIRKSAEGVKVNLIYDSLGSMTTPAGFFQRLRDAGILVLEFNPVNPAKMFGSSGWAFSKRDHRKILVVDGAIAFTGGLNISAVYSGSSAKGARGVEDEEPWRDTHVRIEGPAAAEFQRLFLDTWERQKGPALPDRNYFPDVKPAGKTLVRVVGSLPGESNRLIFLMYMSAISHANNSIFLTTPYFTPDDQMLKALTEASVRGVDVRILLPSVSDSTVVYYASRHYYKRLLESGVHLFERRGGMLHAKTAVVDNVWSTVGSSNMDTQSLLKNDEANAVILGRDFAEAMQAMFEKDVQDSERITLEQWEKRSFGARFKEWFFNLFKHWL